MTKKIVLQIAYQGTSYSGWQYQPNALSIQEVLETILKKIAGFRISVISSGRTDAGVHAQGQIAHFHCPDHPHFTDPRQIQKMLNALLPHDIVIHDAVMTDGDFHSRFSAIAKEYRYTLSLLPKPLPHHRLFCFSPRYKLNIARMQEAAQYLVGTHDFASFANLGREYSSTIRTLYTLDLSEQEHLVTVICRGNGFLYKMVRNIVGALLDIGKGKYPPEHLLDMLATKDRRKGPPSAPPYGLSLHHVCYPPPYQWFCKHEHNNSSEGK
ncbi:tRNA pseudouridine(38-40) synthase TruA [Chlamydia trachomatis]|uniref:tRNA pseudouridine synthase A n=1 Tax=Chlamydia trachomatis serovar A (strain ATCC VR-571B / DSM 19440 / HAR-13) TaxID=315277 RepID=TRUA_CHLTA|nr:tRNA pseudouridine(38-40) synthase TruA [Chlamydia trachomatis]Q3KLN5.1 RecName: Full=tRNA pseudouridine synthase A; AltName: Full=tRNA pseudouridine(38-40) synthase; AltName: Full=tRNA pseudouridylate synthase I; AltName: Full=tRNA-uridine isomerase I [Chlamydia trachomatis A/HAR-13]AAX50737.1 tRNA pseudouridine synthase A [Chlamydia trachomatis A/HAR-13]AOQ16606.1 tRNA pseudouridine(38,39,40) synthase TruA [Chlamydia trachomatis]AOQ17468.1 tRNA pseudouridine(38,39,40) synthase TruA [Chlamy